ncbi:hypothetical protein ACODT3_43955 [Streptomyces sp. 4.24]|uniref:hypothetical protein n=1 Tax=Streptomyces tritrimontium TaxID=3406573 RepID=UPI003BB6B747
MAGKTRGVRIPWVKDSQGNEYDRSAIDIKPVPPYLVPLHCGGCGVEVSVRTGNAEDPGSRMSHFFKPHGREHALWCNFDLPQRGKELLAASQGTVVRKEGQWRLKCPPVSRAGGPDGASGVTRPAGRPPRGGSSGTRPTSKQHGPAIASARRIVRLLKNFRSDTEAVAEFAAIAPDGQSHIAWDEFCLGPQDADRLAQALIDGTARSIPNAVWGPAHTAGAAKKGATHVAMYVARNPVLLDGKRLKLRVAIRCDDPEWIAAHTATGEFLGYGYWELFPDFAKATSRGWIELQLWIREPWQAERWGVSPDAAAPSRSTPPPRPRPPAPSTRDTTARAISGEPPRRSVGEQAASSASPSAGPLPGIARDQPSAASDQPVPEGRDDEPDGQQATEPSPVVDGHDRAPSEATDAGDRLHPPEEPRSQDRPEPASQVESGTVEQPEADEPLPPPVVVPPLPLYPPSVPRVSPEGAKRRWRDRLWRR